MIQIGSSSDIQTSMQSNIPANLLSHGDLRLADAQVVIPSASGGTSMDENQLHYMRSLSISNT